MKFFYNFNKFLILFIDLGLFVSLRIWYKVGGQADLGRQEIYSTPWLTERHGYDPTSKYLKSDKFFITEKTKLDPKFNSVYGETHAKIVVDLATLIERFFYYLVSNK